MRPSGGAAATSALARLWADDECARISSIDSNAASNVGSPRAPALAPAQALAPLPAGSDAPTDSACDCNSESLSRNGFVVVAQVDAEAEAEAESVRQHCLARPPNAASSSACARVNERGTDSDGDMQDASSSAPIPFALRFELEPALPPAPPPQPAVLMPIAVRDVRIGEKLCQAAGVAGAIRGPAAGGAAGPVEKELEEASSSSLGCEPDDAEPKPDVPLPVALISIAAAASDRMRAKCVCCSSSCAADGLLRFRSFRSAELRESVFDVLSLKAPSARASRSERSALLYSAVDSRVLYSTVQYFRSDSSLCSDPLIV